MVWWNPGTWRKPKPSPTPVATPTPNQYTSPIGPVQNSPSPSPSPGGSTGGSSGGSSSGGGGSSSGGSKTVPYNFVGPLQPGTVREEAPPIYSDKPGFIGPVQPSGRSSGGSSGDSFKLQKGSQTAINIQAPDNTGYIGRNPNVPERGVRIVSPEEAKKFSNPTLPYWVVQSKSPAEGVIEGNFAGNTPQINRAINTRGLYMYNQQNILAGQEEYRQYSSIIKNFNSNPSSFEGQAGVTAQSTAGGTSYTLGEDYFKNNINTTQIRTDALSQAKVNYGLLPTSTKNKLRLGGYGQGVSSSVIGIGEFGGTVLANMGMANLEFDTEGNQIKKDRTVKFGGTLGEIRNYPATPTSVTFTQAPFKFIKEKALTPEFGGQATVFIPLIASGGYSGFKNIKNLGWRAGTVETLSGVAPLKVRPGIYGQSITSNTKFNINSAKYTNKAGVTTKIYSGSSGDIKLTGFEKSRVIGGRTVGAGFTQTETPFIQIRSGGAYVNQGIRTTVNPYNFGSSGSGVGYGAKGQGVVSILTPSVRGGTSRVVTSQGTTVYTTSEGSTIFNNFNKGYVTSSGGVTNKVKPGVSKFISGRSKPIYEYVRTGGGDFIYRPSGTVRFNPTVKGTEYNVNALFKQRGGTGAGSSSSSGGGSFNSGGGGSGTILQTRTTTATQGGLNVIVPTVTTPSASTFRPIVLTTPAPTTTRTTTQTIRPTTIQVPRVETITKTDSTTIQVPRVDNANINRSRGRSRNIVVPALNTAQIPQQGQKPATAVVQVRKVKLDTAQTFNFTPSGLTFGGGRGYDAPRPVPIPVIPVPILPGFGGGKGLGIGNVRNRRGPGQYTPSFKALFFKIRGKAPTGTATGLRFRPITKGFSYSTRRGSMGNNIIRVRRVKI